MVLKREAFAPPTEMDVTCTAEVNPFVIVTAAVFDAVPIMVANERALG